MEDKSVCVICQHERCSVNTVSCRCAKCGSSIPVCVKDDDCNDHTRCDCLHSPNLSTGIKLCLACRPKKRKASSINVGRDNYAMHAYGVAVNDEEEANSILRALKKEGWKAARQGIGCYSDSDDIDKTWKEYFVYLKGTDTCVGSRCGSLIEASKTKKKKTVDEKTSQTDHYFPEKVVANGKTYELKYHLMMW